MKARNIYPAAGW